MLSQNELISKVHLAKSKHRAVPRSEIEKRIITWMAHNGIFWMRMGLGIVFFWFGILKLFPTASPAEQLVIKTIPFIHPGVLLPMLAIWEMSIGLGLIFNRYIKFVLLILFVHMLGTLLPLFFLPAICWKFFPCILTLEGQYIVKNLVLIGAGLVIGGNLYRDKYDD